MGDALLALVEKAELCPLVGVDDGQDASNGLADIMDAGELGRATGDLASPELDELAACCQHCNLVHDGLFRATHDLSSWSWTFRSSFDLLHRLEVFCGRCE